MIRMLSTSLSVFLSLLHVNMVTIGVSVCVCALKFIMCTDDGVAFFFLSSTSSSSSSCVLACSFLSLRCSSA